MTQQISREVRLQAHTAADLNRLKQAVQTAFSNAVEIQDLGELVHRNEGTFENRHVDMSPALPSDAGNPSLRHMAKFTVTGDDAVMSLREKLHMAVGALPVSFEGTWVSNSADAIVMAPAQEQGRGGSRVASPSAAPTPSPEPVF